MHTIEAVVGSDAFEKIVVSSNDQDVLDLASEYPQVTGELREERLAGDKVKVIDLVKEIAEREDVKSVFDVLGLFLPTCPFRNADDVRGGVELLTPSDYSVVSVTAMREPVQLSMSVDEETKIVNCEALLSPSPLVTGQTRSQDFQKYYRVNGGFYMAWLDRFRLKDNFFQGQVKAYPMDEYRSVDIDYETDMRYAEFLIREGLVGRSQPPAESASTTPHGTRPDRQAVDRQLAQLELLVLDFDGVLTDDRVWVVEDGREAVACHRGDGMGITLLKEAGLAVVVVSKETNDVVAQRCRKLGLSCLRGVDDKQVALGRLAGEHEVGLDRVAFVGNDVNDLPAMRLAGLGICVADAHPEVMAESDVCLDRRGGHGAVREIADRILKTRGTGNNHG